MTNLVRWDPFSDLRTSMERFFDDGGMRPWRFFSTTDAESGFPLEVAESDDEIEVKAALPGLKPEDVEINVSNGVLTIKGEHKEEDEEKKRGYYRREIHYGVLHRSVSLPSDVDVDKAVAKFDNGMLRLKLPKAEVLRPRQIKISEG